MLMATGAEATDQTREVQTISTAGLLMVLISWHIWRRKRIDRDRAAAILLGLVCKLWPTDSEWHRPIDEIFVACGGACQEGVANIGSGFCAHVDAADQARRRRGAVHTSSLDLLRELVSASFSCCKVADIAGAIVAFIARTLEKDLCERMDSLDALQHSALERKSSRKRMRDEDYRRAVMEIAIKQGRARSSACAAKLGGLRSASVSDWQHRHMAALQAAAWRRCSGFSSVLVVCEDAARLGNPAEDFMVMVAECVEEGFSVYLPSQVMSSGTKGHRTDGAREALGGSLEPAESARGSVLAPSNSPRTATPQAESWLQDLPLQILQMQ